MDERSPTKRFYDEIHALAVDFASQREEIANLKAENERLKELVESNLNIGKKVLGKSDALRIERDALAAENERLRKAGDEMMEVLESEIPFTAMNAVNGWLAAKEGRDAK